MKKNFCSKSNHSYFTLVLFPLVFLFLPLLSFAKGTAAACLIKSDSEKVLMVRDGWSKRWSLPGGWSEPGETSSQTAAREVKEEIGIDVEVGKVLGGEDFPSVQFLVHECKSKEPMPVQMQTLEASENLHLVVHIHPQFLGEVLEARFVNLNNFESYPVPRKPKSSRGLFVYKARFPKQMPKLQDWSLQAQWISEVTSDQKDFSKNAYLEQDLKAVVWLQRNLLGEDHGFLFLFWRVFNFLGEESFYLLMLPMIFVYLGQSFGFFITFTLLLSALANVTLKLVLALPRPQDFNFLLRLTDSYGFGFPSGHTQMASTFFVTLFLFFGNRRWWPILILAAATGLARVVLGAHFVSDVFGGWAFGVLAAFLAFRLKKINSAFSIGKFPLNLQKLVVFAGLAWAVFISYFYDEHSSFVLFSGLAGGAIAWLLGIILNSRLGIQEPSLRHWRSLRNIGILALTLAGIALIKIAVPKFFPDGKSFMVALKESFTVYFGVVFWMGFCPQFFLNKDKDPIRSQG